MAFFIYCRKSTEAEDRQVLSNESQRHELTALAERGRFSIRDILVESHSAKAPGRTIFTDMMKRLEQGEAEGIIAWRLDRLSRNPIDSAALIWAIQKHGIKIVTPTQIFSRENDNTLLMYVEAGMAHKYIEDLSRNVKRGLKTKVEQGWHPGIAPLGYLNDPVSPKGLKRILKDPDRFAVVRKIWDLLLKDSQSVRTICARANDQWGLRMRPNRKERSKPLSLSGLYRILGNPFYTGEFEYPIGSGLWYKGAHEPMVSKEEFRRVQIILGRSTRPRLKTHTFPFTGLIRCGECGSMVTAEEKRKHQKNGNNHYYVYYHCTKRKNPKCQQRSIEHKLLEQQIIGFLSRIAITPRLQTWAMKWLADRDAQERKTRSSVVARVAQTIKDVQEQIMELTRMRYKNLLDDHEFERERTRLKLGLATLSVSDSDLDRQLDATRLKTTEVFDLALRAVEEFEKGTDDIKRAVLAKISSNLVLKNKTLLIEPKKVYQLMEERLQGHRSSPTPLEPDGNGLEKRFSRFRGLTFSVWSGIVEDVRTCIQEELEKQRSDM